MQETSEKSMVVSALAMSMGALLFATAMRYILLLIMAAWRYWLSNIRAAGPRAHWHGSRLLAGCISTQIWVACVQDGVSSFTHSMVNYLKAWVEKALSAPFCEDEASCSFVQLRLDVILL